MILSPPLLILRCVRQISPWLKNMKILLHVEPNRVIFSLMNATSGGRKATCFRYALRDGHI